MVLKDLQGSMVAFIFKNTSDFNKFAQEWPRAKQCFRCIKPFCGGYGYGVCTIPKTLCTSVPGSCISFCKIVHTAFWGSG